jgi:hypothetical protein
VTVNVEEPGREALEAGQNSENMQVNKKPSGIKRKLTKPENIRSECRTI